MRRSQRAVVQLWCLGTLLTLCGSVSEEMQYEADINSISDSFVRVKRDPIPPLPTPTPYPENITMEDEDSTDYYTVQYISPTLGGEKYWRHLDVESGSVEHKSLQSAYRLAVKVKLKSPFLFFGHSVTHVTVATGGFLYMSKFLHSFLTASQYIAPLMANFDTSVGLNESQILYKDDDEVFIVQWSSVMLKDKTSLGKFTFQVQLYKSDGKIVAAYRDIPAPVANLTSNKHPVKVGLSDAYYWDRGHYRTIAPYHTLNASREKVLSNSAIIFRHKNTCNMLTSCDDCLHRQLKGFECYWCSALGQCSDTFDRHRQEWITTGCVYDVNQTNCDHMFPVAQPADNADQVPKKSTTEDTETWKAVTAALCTIFAMSAAVILGIVIYGYRNPQGTIGQFMVRNRPSEMWRKFKGWKDKDESSGNGMSQIR